jgi:hypothetical protein
MTESAPGFSMEQFNINELAGATGLILGAVGGILAIIFKSRCYCKFRVGINDNCSICMCERKPPPDNVAEESDHEEDKPDLIPKSKSFLKKNKTSKGRPVIETEPEPEPEPELSIDRLV